MFVLKQLQGIEGQQESTLVLPGIDANILEKVLIQFNSFHNYLLQILKLQMVLLLYLEMNIHTV